MTASILLELAPSKMIVSAGEICGEAHICSDNLVVVRDRIAGGSRQKLQRLAPRSLLAGLGRT
jgi:hypothetical protein